MQRHDGDLDAARADRIEENGIEVQARRRRRDRPGIAGINRLIVGAVPRIIGAALCDIGRERHMAEAFDGFIEDRAMKIEGEIDLAILRFRFHRRHEVLKLANDALRGFAEDDAVTGGEPFRGPGESAPAIRCEALVKEDLHARHRLAPYAHAEEARRDDARSLRTMTSPARS